MSWLGFDRLRVRHMISTANSSSEVAELSEDEVEITTFSHKPSSINGGTTLEVTTDLNSVDSPDKLPDKLGVEDEASETDGEVKDSETLIASEEIDENGVAREYEVVLKHLGFGFFHAFLLVINGIALTSDAVEVLSISFVLPILNRATEFNIQDWQSALLSSIIFCGMLVGSYFWGGMADVVGRRSTLIVSLLISGVFGLVSAIAPNFWVFIVFRLISGFGVGGSLPVIAPYTAEFIRNKYRGPYLGSQSLFWTLGRFLCGAIAWVIIPLDSINVPFGSYTFRSWRLFIALSALPSILGLFLYLMLPESPRYLLGVGRNREAMKALKRAYRINRWGREKKEFPIKDVVLDGVVVKKPTQVKQRFKNMLDTIIDVLTRSRQLYKRKLLRRTLLLMLIMFCLAFGSYGVTLWFPTYVNDITTKIDEERFESFCARNVTDATSLDLRKYCECSTGTLFHDSLVNGSLLQMWKIEEATFTNVHFKDLRFERVNFTNVVFEECSFSNVTLTETLFINSTWNGVTMEMVHFNSSVFCGEGYSDNITVLPSSTVSMFNVSINDVQNFTSSFDDSANLSSLLYTTGSYNGVCAFREISCDKPFSYRTYRDSFIITCALVPGNLVAIVAVYFFRRNLWLAFTLFVSAGSVFLLYLVHTEAYVIAVLALFTGISTPAWSDSTLISAEVYPTDLRSSAAGVHLLMARIGAIFGTNIFGEFIHVNPSIPVFFVAAVLFVGGVASLALPTTTRKTLLK